MAKMTYWYAEILNDSDVYSIVAKTKKDVLAQMKLSDSNRYAAPVKKELIYKDAFDLFSWATGEAGGRGCGA